MPLEHEPDLHLCKLSAAGDGSAFSALVVRHEARLRAFLARVAGAELADELAQQSFVKAWTSCHRFRGEAQFASWLCGIGWRCFLDHRRAHAGEARRQALAAELAEDGQRFSGDAAMDLTRALALLAPAERAALVLCDGHGWSHNEAARILGLPLGTLKRTAARAKRKCRDYLTAEVM